jgi:ERCC4-related helicase
MVFTQLRLSAKEIKEYLSSVKGVRGELFFGQSKTVGEDEETG